MNDFDGVVSARCLMAMDFDMAKDFLKEAVRNMNQGKENHAAKMAVAALKALGWNVTLERRE